MNLKVVITALISCTIIWVLSYKFIISTDGFPSNTLKKEGWVLVINDEFDGSELNESIWIPEYFPGRFKTPVKANYDIKNGKLHIYGGSIQTFNTHNLHKKYESTNFEVETVNKFTQLYGYYEIRAKHSDTAHHIAFWALEAKAAGSEIDITEDQAWVGPNWHKWGSPHPFPEKRNVIKRYDSITTKEQRASEFHLYALEVYPNGARIYHDNILIEEVEINWKKRKEVPLMFLLGIYENRNGGKPYVIDYFRAYKRDSKFQN